MGNNTNKRQVGKMLIISPKSGDAISCEKAELILTDENLTLIKIAKIIRLNTELRNPPISNDFFSNADSLQLDTMLNKLEVKQSSILN
jgi:hypothetical protein